jgi:hypothetical protein
MLCLVPLSVAQTIWRRMMEWLVNNKLEGMWEEVVMAEFEVPTRHLLKGMNKTMKYIKLSGLWS